MVATVELAVAPLSVSLSCEDLSCQRPTPDIPTNVDRRYGSLVLPIGRQGVQLSRNNKKKNSKKNKKRRQRRASSLGEHRQQGKDLNPPLKAVGPIIETSWLRDSFPDFIWICLQLSTSLALGRTLVVQALDAANSAMDAVFGNTPEDRPVFDGSLTSWEAIESETVREQFLGRIIDSGRYEDTFPKEFATILGMYPGAPGLWLTEPWRQKPDFRVDPDVASKALDKLIVLAADKNTAPATQTMGVGLRGLMVGRKISFADDIATLDLLAKWPHEPMTENETQRVEAFVRATFGIVSNASGGLESRRAWAKNFWRSNWRIYPCTFQPQESSSPNVETVQKALVDANEAIDVLTAKFDQAAIASDPDLFTPDRYEVLTGITARCLRVASGHVLSPTNWNLERSVFTIRALAESLINLKWLTERNDPEMYARFIAYGMGRLKLLKLHWEEHAEALGDDVTDDVERTIRDLERLVNQEATEEIQTIDLRGSFSGIDVRRMADEVGLSREYRLIFAPASNESHGDFAHLDRYSLSRCATPSHRWHRIQRSGLMPDIAPETLGDVLDLAKRVVDLYCTTIDIQGDVAT